MVTPAQLLDSPCVVVSRVRWLDKVETVPINSLPMASPDYHGIKDHGSRFFYFINSFFIPVIAAII
jgi:hypothetical protein